MRKALSFVVAAAIAVTSLAAPVAVQASPLKSVTGINQPTVQDVQYVYDSRRYYGGPRYYGGSRYYGRPYYGRRHYRHRRNNAGAVAAAGVVGLAAGVIAGQALAQPRVAPAPVYGDRHAYCYSRYKSYDARSGTYLGYDGRRHYCR